VRVSRTSPLVLPNAALTNDISASSGKPCSESGDTHQSHDNAWDACRMTFARTRPYLAGGLGHTELGHKVQQQVQAT
jgi:hypothetical protein